MSLSLVGLNSNCFPSGSSINRIAQCIKSKQRADGGWADVEETMWCAIFLKSIQDQASAKKALGWLHEQQLANGAWGYSSRDRGRIPITGLLLYLLPELATESSIKWLREIWTTDLKSQPTLTYKAAYVLMALKEQSVLQQDSLISQTSEWLQKEQNDDGGWGPWKDHPVGSSAEHTGIALIGILAYPDLVDQEVITKAMRWLMDKQLPNGLWPAHYIEQGSAWALSGLIQGLRYLQTCRS